MIVHYEKMLPQAYVLFGFDLAPPFPILMSTREIWLLAIFVWREAKIYLKLLQLDNILPMTSNLKILLCFSDLEQFL